MSNTFEEIRIDNSVMEAVELFKLARNQQCKIVDKVYKKVKKYHGPEWETYKKEATKLDYICWQIKNLEAKKQ